MLESFYILTNKGGILSSLYLYVRVQKIHFTHMSKKEQQNKGNILIFSIISFQLENVETSITRFLSILLFSFFPSKLKKLNIPPFMKNSSDFFQWIFLVLNLFLVLIYKFCKKTNFNPTTRGTSWTTSSWVSTRNDGIGIYYT